MAGTLFLRALAALLIANSHLEGFYPSDRLAVDGLLGNSLFFLLSGYGLVLAESRGRRAFPDWYGRRLGRVWPSAFLVTLVFEFLLGGGWRAWGWREGLAHFGWGYHYPFVREILILYAIAFPFVRSGRLGAFVGGIVLTMPLYAIGPTAPAWPSYGLLHTLFYFQMMLLGGWLAHRPGATRPAGRGTILALFALAPAYVGVRYAVGAGVVPRWAFLPQAMVVPIAIGLVRLANSATVSRLMARRVAGPAIAAVGASSLEIYLVHYHVFRFGPVAGLRFPVNLVAFFALTLGLAWATARCASRLRGPSAAAPPRANPTAA